MHYKHYYFTGFCTFNIVLEPNGVFLNWLLSTATCIFSLLGTGKAIFLFPLFRNKFSISN